jgi:sugar lactone lactonase YvrE
MSALSTAKSRSGGLKALAALVAALAIGLSGPAKANSIGLGPSGWYSFGASDCNEGSRSDPIGVLFRGKRASAHNVANQIKLHANWNYDVSKGQYLWVLLNGGSYDCRDASESVAEAPDFSTLDNPNPANSRYHIRLWFIPATNGSSELKTIGTPHHEDWKWNIPFVNHCGGVTGFGNHAIDEGGIHQHKDSGFDQGRHKLKEGFENGGHLVQSEEWGNSTEIEQCDGGWAGSDGWGLNIWVNHAIEPRTLSGSATSSGAVTMKGTLATEEPSTDWWFGYGPNPSHGISGYPYKTAVRSTSATGEISVNEAVSGVCPSTTYYARLFARNPNGEVEEGNEVQYLTCRLAKDLYGVLMNKTGTAKSEIHILDSATNYSTFRLEVPTALEETTASQWQFSFGDYNRDGIPDLIGVLMKGTGSGKTEVHVLDGATNYSTFLLHAATTLSETTSSQWQFTTGDYNRDGIPDLIGVLMNGTGSGRTEIHILNGATDYTGPTLLSVATGLGETTSSQWQFTAGDYNRDGIPDLMGVLMKGTGSGKTEVHILDGATNYSTFLLHGVTGLDETKPQQWQFSADDYNGDGIPDLLGVLMNGPTGTGKTEAHILNGATNYSAFMLHAGTALGETTASQWQFSGAHVSGDWHPTTTTEPATGIGTEAATLNGAVNPQGISTTYHFDYGTTSSYGSSTPENGSIGNGTSSVPVGRAIGGLSPGTTYHFRVVATNLEGASYGQDRTFTTASSGTAAALSGMAIAEPFDGSSGSLANFGANWAALGWASGTTPKGSDTTTGWRPVDAYSTVNGAYYNQPVNDLGWGIGTAATLAKNPELEGRYFSLWLDMPSPTATTRAGYELRFTDTAANLYTVALSKWAGGTQTQLASKAGYTFLNGNSLALVDIGGTVSAWTNTGSGYTQLLSAPDTTYAGGKAGIEGSGNFTRLTNFKAAQLKLPPKAVTEAATNVKMGQATLNASVNPQGTPTTYQIEYGTSVSYGSKVPASPAAIGSGSNSVAVAQTATPLEAGTSYHYRVVGTSEAGTAYGEDKTVTTPSTPSYLSSVGTAGTGNGQFAHPAGIAIDAANNVWVVDQNNCRLEKFNANGEYLTKFGSCGTGNGQFGRPTDVAIDPKGNLWVTDANNSRLEKFNANGEYLTKFGSYGSGNGQLNQAETLAIDAKGNIWVGDTYNSRVEKFNEAGEFVKVVGSYGTGNGQMIESAGIAIGPGGNVWVADWGGNRVTEFNEAGEFVRQFGSYGTGNGQFNAPDVIEVDGYGNVWVGDQKNARIQRFTETGVYKSQFGTAGSGAGQFSFGWPMGIASDSNGNLWVADTGNNRVQKWG